MRTTHLLTEPENAATSNFSTAGTHFSRYPNRILTRYVMFVPMSALQRAREAIAPVRKDRPDTAPLCDKS
jgi:hypothetical protein